MSTSADLLEDIEALKALALAQREQLIALNAELCTHAPLTPRQLRRHHQVKLGPLITGPQDGPPEWQISLFQREMGRNWHGGKLWG